MRLVNLFFFKIPAHFPLDFTIIDMIDMVAFGGMVVSVGMLNIKIEGGEENGGE